jgi:hypothetical protein
MSDSFTNWLSRTGNTIFKSYSHATGLYVNDNYARAPKLGFLYFVAFDINRDAVLDPVWKENSRRDLGLLVNKIDLPKFKIKTETVNQYNRKTQVATGLTYDPVNIEFHDDNSEITNGLWKNYYKYHVADSNYGDDRGGIKSFADTKYGTVDYSYGLDSYPIKRFFNAIDIYVLHQQNFTRISLINPKISAWDHATLDQDPGNNVLKNKMTVVYEDVLYFQGKIVKGDEPLGFAAKYYDNTPSAISVGGSKKSTPSGKVDVFGPKPGESREARALAKQPVSVNSPSVSQLQKAKAKNNGAAKLTSKFKNGTPVAQQSQLQKANGKNTSMGTIQSSTGAKTNTSNSGFNIYSGRSNATAADTGNPVKLTTKK